MLIPQRTTTDCAICCLAMAFEVSYEDILERAPGFGDREARGDNPGLHTAEELAVIHSFGWGARTFYKWWFEKNGGKFWKELKRRRAILTLPSLNIEGGYHSVFWDGARLLDPSPAKKYSPELVPISTHVRVLVPPAMG